VPGAGVTAKVGGREIVVGKADLLCERGVRGVDSAREAAAEYDARGAMLAFCGIDGEVMGFVVAEDRPRPEAAEAIAQLRDAGIENTILLTGDHERAARAVRQAVGIRVHRADLLPDQKAQVIRELTESGRAVAVVGDGVNDAPALATATVGVAMGDVATDITVDAADVVLAAPDLRRIPQLVRFSRRTMATISMNVIWFAVLFNAIGVLLSARGVIGPVGAAVYHQIASLLVCGNSLRLLTAGRLEERGRLGRLRDRIARGFGSALDRVRHVRWTWLRDCVQQHRASLVRWGPVVLVVAYLASGLYAVGPAEVAVVRRLGRQHGEAREPGLHCGLPWPFDRVTPVKANIVRAVEIGYRTLPGGEEAGGYEWENPHEAGAYEKKTEESLKLTGDETVLDVNICVQYRIGDAHQYLFHVADEAALCRVVAETAARQVIGERTLDGVLTDARRELETRMHEVADALFERYESGIEVVAVRLLDVHPPMQVVPAFREVASALEEKRTAVNQAEAYANERVPKAKGEAEALKLRAEAWSRTRTDEATGDAERFRLIEAAHRRAPQVTEIRLHLQAVEKALAPRKKLILNRRGGGRRQMLLLDAQGLRLQGGVPAEPAQQLPAFPEEEEEEYLGDAQDRVPVTPPERAAPSADQEREPQPPANASEVTTE
jgi:HflK protein